MVQVRGLEANDIWNCRTAIIFELGISYKNVVQTQFPFINF